MGVDVVLTISHHLPFQLSDYLLAEVLSRLSPLKTSLLCRHSSYLFDIGTGDRVYWKRRLASDVIALPYRKLAGSALNRVNKTMNSPKDLQQIYTEMHHRQDNQKNPSYIHAIPLADPSGMIDGWEVLTSSFDDVCELDVLLSTPSASPFEVPTSNPPDLPTTPREFKRMKFVRRYSGISDALNSYVGLSRMVKSQKRVRNAYESSYSSREGLPNSEEHCALENTGLLQSVVCPIDPMMFSGKYAFGVMPPTDCVEAAVIAPTPQSAQPQGLGVMPRYEMHSLWLFDWTKTEWTAEKCDLPMPYSSQHILSVYANPSREEFSLIFTDNSLLVYARKPGRTDWVPTYRESPRATPPHLCWTVGGDLSIDGKGMAGQPSDEAFTFSSPAGYSRTGNLVVEITPRAQLSSSKSSWHDSSSRITHIRLVSDFITIARKTRRPSAQMWDYEKPRTVITTSTISCLHWHDGRYYLVFI